MSARYLVRFDDICPTMNWKIWGRIEAILLEHGVKPLLAVVPDNQDPNLVVRGPNPDFWDRVLQLQDWGWTIGMHGYRHVYQTRKIDILGLKAWSEFTGLSHEEQEAKIAKGLEIFQREGIKPSMWVAPGHSFDEITVRALQRHDIDVISDGFFLRPVLYHGSVWIPQQLWHFRPFPRGLWTVCYHHNTFQDKDLTQFEADIRRYINQLVSLDQLLSSHDIQNIGLLDKLTAAGWMRLVRIKHMLPAVRDTSRCKVLFLIPTLTGGGSERVMITLLNHMDRSRFQLALGVVDTRRTVFRDEVPADVEFIDLNCTRVRYAVPKILRLVRSVRPKVVLSTLGHLNLALAAAKPLFPKGVRLIGRESTVVSQGLTCYKLSRLWAWGYRRFYPRLDHVV